MTPETLSLRTEPATYARAMTHYAERTCPCDHESVRCTGDLGYEVVYCEHCRPDNLD